MNLLAYVLITPAPVFVWLLVTPRHQLVQLEVCPGLSSVHKAFINDVSPWNTVVISKNIPLAQILLLCYHTSPVCDSETNQASARDWQLFQWASKAKLCTWQSMTYPLPAHMPVPVQHEYNIQQACRDLAGRCVLSLGVLSDTHSTWIWDPRMMGEYCRGWASFQLWVAVGMHVESVKCDDKGMIPTAVDYSLPS